MKYALVHQMSIPALSFPQYCTCSGQPHPFQPHFWEMALSFITGAARTDSLPPFLIIKKRQGERVHLMLAWRLSLYWEQTIYSRQTELKAIIKVILLMPSPASLHLPEGSKFLQKTQLYITEKNKTAILPFQLDSTLQYLPGTFQDGWRDSV